MLKKNRPAKAVFFCLPFVFGYCRSAISDRSPRIRTIGNKTVTRHPIGLRVNKEYILLSIQPNKLDPQESDNFTLQVSRETIPNCLADFDGGLATFSLGYQACSAEYDVTLDPEPFWKGAMILTRRVPEASATSVFAKTIRIWQPDGQNLAAENSVITQSIHEQIRDVRKITRVSLK